MSWILVLNDIKTRNETYPVTGLIDAYGKEPELIEGDSFQTIVPLPEFFARDSASEDIPEQKAGTVNGTANGTVNGTVNMKPILMILKKSPEATYDEISESLKLPRRTVAREIKALRESGLIKRIGSDKVGHWEVSEN